MPTCSDTLSYIFVISKAIKRIEEQAVKTLPTISMDRELAVVLLGLLLIPSAVLQSKTCYAPDLGDRSQ